MAQRNDIQIRILAELGDLKRGLAEVKGLVGESAGGLSKGFGGLNALLRTTVAQLGAAAAGFGTMKAALGTLTTAGEFEALQARLRSLYGDSAAAAEAFRIFSETAASTPFSLQNVIDAGARLKAFGAEATDLIGTISDLASYMQVDIVEAADAFGRAFANGAGAADILRDRGILNLVKATRQLGDLSKSELPAFRDALIATLQDPAAGIAGSTERMAETWQGALSNMGDAWAQFAAALGGPGLDGLKGLVRAATEQLSRFTGAMRQAFGTDEAAVLEGQRLELRRLTDQLRFLREQSELTASQQTVLADTVERMVELAPQHLKDLDLEADAWYKVREAVDAANEGLERQIRAVVLKEKLVEIDRQRLALEQEQAAIIRAQSADVSRLEALAGDARRTVSGLVDGWKLDVIDALQTLGREGNLTAASGTGDLLRALEQSIESVLGPERELRAQFALNEGALSALNDEYNRTLLLVPDVGSAIKRAGDAAGEGAAATERGAARTAKALLAVSDATQAIVSRDRDLRAVWLADQLRSGELSLEQATSYQAELLKLWDEANKDFRTSRRRDAKQSFDDLERSAAQERALYERNFEEIKALSGAVADQLGAAFQGAFEGNMDGLRDALKQSLLLILDAVKAQMQAAQIAAISKAIVAAGLNPFAAIPDIMKELPALVGIEALFAGLRATVTGFKDGGVIDKPTLALIGENARHSGREIIAPEKPFKAELKRWLVEMGSVAGGGLSDEDRGLLVQIRDRLAPAKFGREMGRSFQGGLAPAMRSAL